MSMVVINLPLPDKADFGFQPSIHPELLITSNYAGSRVRADNTTEITPAMVS